eukprot:3364999-Amphidinium_carterae.1
MQRLEQNMRKGQKQTTIVVTIPQEWRTEATELSDYAYIRGDSDKYKARILTMCETKTGLGFATVVPRKGAICDFIKAIKRVVVENGLHCNKQPFYNQTMKLPYLNYSRRLPNSYLTSNTNNLQTTPINGYKGKIPSDNLCTTEDYKVPNLQRL